MAAEKIVSACFMSVVVTLLQITSPVDATFFNPSPMSEYSMHESGNQSTLHKAGTCTSMNRKSQKNTKKRKVESPYINKRTTSPSRGCFLKSSFMFITVVCQSVSLFFPFLGYPKKLIQVSPLKLDFCRYRDYC